MVEINRDYPMCDSDIWIKNSKHREFYGKDLIFSVYDKIYMCDAVRSEIGRSRSDNKQKDFEIGLREFKKSYDDKKINIVRLNNTEYINEEMFQAIERQLHTRGIIYNRETGKYESTLADTGETVTVIVASILDIPIILCDEEKEESIVKKYKTLDVRNILHLLEKVHGSDISTLQNIRWKLSTPIEDKPNMFKSIKRDYSAANKINKFKNKYVTA